MQRGILLEVGNNRHGSPRVGETSTAAASSMLPDATRHFYYWLLLWHDGGDGPPRRRFTSPRAPLKIQEHATLLDSETVSLLWLASKEPCESSEMVGPSQSSFEGFGGGGLPYVGGEARGLCSSRYRIHQSRYLLNNFFIVSTTEQRTTYLCKDFRYRNVTTRSDVFEGGCFTLQKSEICVVISRDTKHPLHSVTKTKQEPSNLGYRLLRPEMDRKSKTGLTGKEQRH
jgi:hypothetical protein